MENFVSNILILLDFLRSIRPIVVAAAVGQEQHSYFHSLFFSMAWHVQQTILAYFLDPAAHRAVLRCRTAEATWWRTE
jgi:hypothetical protein